MNNIFSRREYRLYKRHDDPMKSDGRYNRTVSNCIDNCKHNTQKIFLRIRHTMHSPVVQMIKYIMQINK
jgi:hypothetical protein